MENIIQEIEAAENLTFDRSFELAQLCSQQLRVNENDGRRLMINILNNWNKIPSTTIEIWTDLLEAAGFYPYLKKNEDFIKFKNLPGEIRKEIHLSRNLSSKYFHAEQYELLQLLEKEINIILSAPTSFGKSLLIEEIIASGHYKNIVIIQPTLALLDETRKKLIKYKDSYKLIVRTSQVPSETLGNVFLFTAERVNEYQFFPDIHFLVIDEFYKLSGNRDDERSSSLNNAFYYLITKFSPKFYLLGPNIDEISWGFTEKYNAAFYKSDYSLVDSREIDLYKEYDGNFGVRGLKKEYKEKVLFDLLFSLTDEQNIIYCSSPQRVRYLSKAFTQYLKEKNVPETIEDYPLIEWIENYITKGWSVLHNLKRNIGIHDGALQKHISTSIIDYFNQGKIKYLFCTSTIIEGVNTSAKNIIYFDSKKGPNSVDFFDYSNIKGRAGRMMIHYVGRIYNFNPTPKHERIIIDIPFFEQNPIKDEVLIQLKEDEVKDKESEQYKLIEKIPIAEKEVIKLNGVRVHGQKSIFDTLRKEIPLKHYLVNWDSYPTKEQLEYVLGLAWDNLIIEGETIKPMTKNKLVTMTSIYGFKQDINYLIDSDFTWKRGKREYKKYSDEDLLDISIQETFQIIKHWFEYKIPKWLSVVNEIQRFICSEKGLRPGNYTYYANLIENDFLRQNLSILAEYGIPSSAIRKLEKQIPDSVNQDSVLDFIKDKKLFESTDLLEYEKYKLKENIY
jgi:hypothetical protein